MLKTAPEFIIKTVGDGAAAVLYARVFGVTSDGTVLYVQSHLQLDLDQWNAMDEVSTGEK